MVGNIGKDTFQRKRAQELKMQGSGETAKAVEKIQSFLGAEALSAEVGKGTGERGADNRSGAYGNPVEFYG